MPRRTLKRWRIVILAVIALLVVLAVFWATPRPRSSPLLSLPNAKKQAFEPADPYRLGTRAVSAVTREHLLDSEFKLVNQVSQIPQNCISSFDSSFTNAEGAPAGARVQLADPGQPFQYSDAIVPGLPFRRLLFAGIAPESCFVYYQHGGVMYPSYCLVVSDKSSTHAIWVGESRKRANNLQDLRSMLVRSEFSDTAGPVC